MEENKARQIEEIEALSAIYEQSFELENENSYSVVLEEEGTCVRLFVQLNPEYPSAGPPTYTLSAPTFNAQQRRELCNKLESIYLENLGECVVFLWSEEIREYLNNMETSSDSNLNCAETSSVNIKKLSDRYSDNSENEINTICDSLGTLLGESSVTGRNAVPCPAIFTGECFEDRKSVFQGHVAVVNSVEDVKAAISKLYENKKVAHATHNIYAYRIYSEQKKSFLQDCEDDGESAAGGRMLHLLEILDVRNILTVVSRWYGGIQLGPDRFKHINNAARQVLEQSGLLAADKSTKKKKK